MRTRVRPRQLAVASVAGVVLTSLTACGGGDSSQPGASDGPASDAANASPSEPAVDLKASAPQGKYKVRIRTLKQWPKKSTPVKGEKRVWTVNVTDCSETSCNGKILSTSGAIYNFTWDGTNMELSRKPFKDKLTCQPSGWFKYRWDYTYPEAKVSGGSATTPPEQIEVVLEQSVTVTKKNNCDPSPTDALRIRSKVNGVRQK